MDELADVTYYLEYLFLKRIINGLESKELDETKSKEYASDFLKMEPFSSIEDAKTKVAAYVGQHQFFQDLADYISAYHDEKRVTAVIDKMRKYLKSNEIEKALEIAKAK